jgi:NADH/NAD ratio-sensing transcriptional regulator Rex
MYRRLREIEANLQKEDLTISDVSVLEAKLENVDRAIHILAVPMQHSELFFSIKSHLDEVRVRLAARLAQVRSQTAKAA